MKRKIKRKHRKRDAWGCLVRCMDLPAFSAGTDECVEVYGGNTVQIEGAKGIHTYEREVVKVHMKQYLLAIYGSDFELLHFTDGTLRVLGTLRSLCWEAEG
ncbi:MAG: YabP/YqfC family sporulation protein [Clostridia bacterium]|nr:YabP/YqfC family sporulation protein [Clostridia bacterium]